jgi:formylglycine-generating enzyme required for sulfatase activity
VVEENAASPENQPAGANRPAGAEPSGRPRGNRSELLRVLDVLQKQAPEHPKLVVASLGLKMMLIPAGSFPMGSPETEAERRPNEGPVHEVLFDKPFYLAAHPVTQEQYERLTGTNPSRFTPPRGGGPDHPVECVTWDEAVEFCRRLSEQPQERQAGRRFRLPTEAEWEYACRAGTTQPFAYGPALTADLANFDSTGAYGGPSAPAPARTTPVGSFAANNFGLHDMHGNVWEWCADWYGHDSYGRSPRHAPLGPETGSYRVVRGGSWRNHGATCRAAYRNAYRPVHRDFATGFRVVAVLLADLEGRGPRLGR